jgi:hypothetical protein
LDNYMPKEGEDRPFMSNKKWGSFIITGKIYYTKF